MVNRFAEKWYGIDFRLNPKKYHIGRGEQGVLTAEPYKSEILPHWRFRTPEIAEKSARKIYELFLEYKKSNDFVGMDMSRKFLQMGFTRSRRYANHKTGQKYIGPVPDGLKGVSGAHGREIAALDPDPIKAISAEKFRVYWKMVLEDQKYILMKKQWKHD